MGAAPDWYYLFLAADRLHCTPMEAAQLPLWWIQRALLVTAAEGAAQQDPRQQGAGETFIPLP